MKSGGQDLRKPAPLLEQSEALHFLLEERVAAAGAALTEAAGAQDLAGSEAGA